MAPRCLGLVVALASLAPPAGAQPAAEPPGPPVTVRVDFAAPARCSSAGAFFADLASRTPRVRRATGGAATSDARIRDGQVRLRVRMTRVGARVRGELRVLDSKGQSDTRRVEGATCAEVVDALALTAALALDPAASTAVLPSGGSADAGNLGGEAAGSSGAPLTSPSANSSNNPGSTPSDAALSPTDGEPGEKTPPTAPATTPDATNPATANKETEPPPQTPEPEHADTEAGGPDGGDISARPANEGEASLRAGLGVGTLLAEAVSPFVSIGASVSVRLGYHADDQAGPSLDLTGFYLPNDWLSTPDVAIHLTGAALTACPGWALGDTLRIEPCLRAMAGRLSADATGISNPTPVTRSWWSAGGLLRIALQTGGGVAINAEAGATVPIVKRTFTTSTPERVRGETPAVSAFVGLGVVKEW